MSFSKTTKTKSKAPSQETELLIESMQKLIDHMNENQTHQEEIFKSLTSNDVIKIIQNFDDTSVLMRKTSAAFLCELVYDNEKVQQGFCEITKILQSEGKVCVTKIPQAFLAHAKNIPEIFEIIKSTPQPHDYPLCWYYELPSDKNYKKGLKYLKFERNTVGKTAKQRILQFIDPSSLNTLETPQKSIEEPQQFVDIKPIVPKSRPLTQLSSTSQSPQHHIQGRKTVSAALNHSVDLSSMVGMSTSRLPTEQKTFTSHSFIHKSTDEQFHPIREVGNPKPEQATKPQAYTSMRDNKLALKPKAGKSTRK